MLGIAVVASTLILSLQLSLELILSLQLSLEQKTAV